MFETGNKDGLPWTTARCNRLLRPIASRVALLRRHCNDVWSVDSDFIKPEHVNEPQLTRVSQTSNYEIRAIADDGQNLRDPDWSPFVSRKQVKRKYSSQRSGVLSGSIGDEMITEKEHKMQRKRQRQTKCQPGEIVIPTPLIARFSADLLREGDEHFLAASVQRELPCDSCLAPDHAIWRRKSQVSGNVIPRDYHACLRCLKISVAPVLYAMIDGLHRGLDVLLRETTEDPLQSRKGSPSLFRMCLRQVPLYIAREEHWRTGQDPDDDSNVSADVYADLEGLGSSQTGGWKSLREVVRAHGIYLFKVLVGERLLPFAAVKTLIDLCVEHEAFREAEEIIDSLTMSTAFGARPSDSDSHPFDNATYLWMSVLEKYVKRTGRHGFQLHAIAAKLSSRKLCIQWISTESMQSVWVTVIRSISGHDEHYPAAVKLLSVAFRFTYELRNEGDSDVITRPSDAGHTPVKPYSSKNKYKEDAVGNTTSSLLTLLTSIAFLQLERTGGNWCLVGSSSHVIWALWNLSVTVLGEFTKFRSRSVHNDAFARCVRKAAPVLATTLILSTCIAHSVDSRSRCAVDFIVALEADVTFGTQISRKSGSFAESICSIARCCGRASHTDGFEHLERVIAAFTTFAHKSVTSEVEGLSRFFSQITIGAALSFAEKSGQSKHFTFLKSLDHSAWCPVPHQAKEGDRFSSQPKIPDGSSRYRWEEGICEWVMASPSFPVRRDESHTHFLLPSGSTSPTSENYEDCREPIQRNITSTLMLHRGIGEKERNLQSSADNESCPQAAENHAQESSLPRSSQDTLPDHPRRSQEPQHVNPTIEINRMRRIPRMSQSQPSKAGASQQPCTETLISADSGDDELSLAEEPPKHIRFSRNGQGGRLLRPRQRAGLYRMKRVVGSGRRAYKLDLASRSQLETHPRTDPYAQLLPPPGPVRQEGDTPEWQSYEIEQLVHKRRSRGQLQYLVRWVGYGPQWDEWYDVELLEQAQTLVDEFEAAYE